jgi:hypothetical protein
MLRGDVKGVDVSNLLPTMKVELDGMYHPERISLSTALPKKVFRTFWRLISW